jgi:hypothetical protein
VTDHNALVIGSFDEPVGSHSESLLKMNEVLACYARISASAQASPANNAIYHVLKLR